MDSGPQKESLQPSTPPKQAWIWPFNHFQEEWPVVKTAKWSFAVISCASVAVGVVAIMSLYSAFVLPGKEATISYLNTQLAGVNRDNDKLQKRNDALEAYHGKDAPPLKKNALILAAQVHELIKAWNGQQNETPFIQNYKLRFQDRVNVIRDDLDQNNAHSDDLDKDVNAWIMLGQTSIAKAKSIADEIERLANKLPD